MDIVLASQSPRRRGLFSLITDNFIVDSFDVDESIDEKYSADKACLMLAEKKCRAAFQNYSEKCIVACDTVVEIDGKILGKPIDEADAFSMLRALSNNTHNVYTGVYISCGGTIRSFAQKTSVTFCKLSDSDIYGYILTGEPFDKAGGYGIQGKAAKFVTEISGDYFNVMGLPLSRLWRELTELGMAL